MFSTDYVYPLYFKMIWDIFVYIYLSKTWKTHLCIFPGATLREPDTRFSTYSKSVFVAIFIHVCLVPDQLPPGRGPKNINGRRGLPYPKMLKFVPSRLTAAVMLTFSSSFDTEGQTFIKKITKRKKPIHNTCSIESQWIWLYKDKDFWQKQNKTRYRYMSLFYHYSWADCVVWIA